MEEGTVREETTIVTDPVPDPAEEKRVQTPDQHIVKETTVETPDSGDDKGDDE